MAELADLEMADAEKGKLGRVAYDAVSGYGGLVDL